MGCKHQVEKDVTNTLEQHPNWKIVNVGGNHRIQETFMFFFSLLFWLRQSELETIFLMEANLVQEEMSCKRGKIGFIL
nr:hypothetical protein CFP56_03415 [Quercus suber]